MKWNDQDQILPPIFHDIIFCDEKEVYLGWMERDTEECDPNFIDSITRNNIENVKFWMLKPLLPNELKREEKK